MKKSILLPKKNLLLFIFTSLLINANAQRWGQYTLYGDVNSNKIHLIDLDGSKFKTWTFNSTSLTAFSSYLLDGDTLLRTVKYKDNVINVGGVSGEIQKVDWNNNIVWDYVYSDSNHALHHDICPLPNGNILMIAFEKKTIEEADSVGRIPLPPSKTPTVLLSEKIIEVHPTGAHSGTIVWEWKLWDHICQNSNPLKQNYVNESTPKLIDINYNIYDPTHNINDFFHMNSIDYNPTLDQIAFTSYYYSEVCIIDHSTTTAQAAAHSGGNSGYGGDIIYRWGNPKAYGLHPFSDLHVSHDVHWIPSSYIHPDSTGYYLSVFNNNDGGVESIVDIIHTPNKGYNYTLDTGVNPTYGPLLPIHKTSVPQNQTTIMGSGQQLPNGNTLVSISTKFIIMEVDKKDSVLWKFSTFDSSSSQHFPFTSAIRYEKCKIRGISAYVTATDTQITNGGTVTLNSHITCFTEDTNYTYLWSNGATTANPNFSPSTSAKYTLTVTNNAGCSDTASVTVKVITNGINEPDKKNTINIFPNPTSGIFTIQNNSALNSELCIYNAIGELVNKEIWNKEILQKTFDISQFPKGIYFIRLNNESRKIITE